MIVFGIDIPLIEIILAIGIILFILLVEVIVVVALLVRELNKTRKLGELISTLSNTLLEIKKKEIEELDKLRGK